MTIAFEQSLPQPQDFIHGQLPLPLKPSLFSEDVAPLKILIVNLMPTKLETEKQFLRVLGDTPFYTKVDFLYTQSHRPKHVEEGYLATHYKTLSQIRDQQYDGMIITGAPVEHLEFEEVDYWEELTKIMDYSKTNVGSTFHICWAAQAGLYHHYGIPKYPLPQKVFGVFPHTVSHGSIPLFKGFDDEFLVPHSRHTEIRRKDIESVKELEILSESKESGIYIVAARNGKQFFVTGHSEYDAHTLKQEYERDISKGLDIQLPKNYFKRDNPLEEPIVRWKAHCRLLFTNWLHQYAFKNSPLYHTPQIEKINKGGVIACLK